MNLRQLETDARRFANITGQRAFLVFPKGLEGDLPVVSRTVRDGDRVAKSFQPKDGDSIAKSFQPKDGIRKSASTGTGVSPTWGDHRANDRNEAKVLASLQEKPLTYPEVVEKTGLGKASAYWALHRLRDAGKIASRRAAREAGRAGRTRLVWELAQHNTEVPSTPDNAAAGSA